MKSVERSYGLRAAIHLFNFERQLWAESASATTGIESLLSQFTDANGPSALGPYSVIRAEPKPRPFGSPKRRHLQFGGLAIDGLARIVDGSLERFPSLTDDVFIGADSAFCC